MSDILFDDVPVEQQETVVGGESYSSFSSTKAEGVNETLETINLDWLKDLVNSFWIIVPTPIQ